MNNKQHKLIITSGYLLPLNPNAVNRCESWYIVDISTNRVIQSEYSETIAKKIYENITKTRR